MKLVTKGIVLREAAYKESDKILTVLTQEHGQLTVSARASRKKGGGVSAAAQLLVWSEMTLSEHNGRWTLTEAMTEREFRHVRTDLDRLALGSYFAEVTELLTEEAGTHEELLALLLNSLYVLDTTDRPLALVKSAFELRAMCLAGYQPMLEHCAHCGNEPEVPMLGLQSGVVRCRDCGIESEEQSARLDPASLAAMRFVVNSPRGKVFSFRVGEEAQRRMSAACERFLVTQLERGFHTLNFYHDLSGISPVSGEKPV